MNKVADTVEAAVADIPRGATVAIAGFGIGHRFANGLIKALREQGTKDLTLVCNSLGGAGLRGQSLVENKQIKKLIAAFSVRPGPVSAAEAQILSGELEVELVGQGILVERCRAGGAGIPAFYSPTGADTDLAAGKDIRYFNGRPYVLENAISVDYALLSAFRADKAGNVQFRGGSRNLNPSFAKAAKVAIVEVEEIVEIGGLAPDLIDLPGIFIDRVVKTNQPLEDVNSFKRSNRRAAESGRLYNGKPGLTRAGIAKNAAQILRNGSYVNLGVGIPTQVCNFLEGKGVWLHSENGILGYGGLATGDELNLDVYNASGEFVTLVPGASFFDSVTSFEMSRGGHLDAVILGAYEVDQHGNVANWSLADSKRGGIGGAMDLLAGKAELIIVMEHRDSKNRPKLRRECMYPLTGRGCVNWIVTDLAVLKRKDNKFRIEAIAPGFSVEEIVALTEMPVEVSSHLETMI